MVVGVAQHAAVAVFASHCKIGYPLAVGDECSINVTDVEHAS